MPEVFGRCFSRRKALRGAGAALVSVLFAKGAGAERPAEKGLDELLAAFRKSPGLAARFVEEKHIALLKAPLKSEGALYFLPQDKLARHVERPKRSVLLVDGTKLSVADERGARSLDLARSPALAALVQSFAQVLRGDRAALDENYRVQFRSAGEGGGEPGRWRLRLVPRAEPLNKLIESIELTGAGAVIASLVVAESNGDRSVTRFSGVETNRRFSAEERKRLFSLPAR